VDRNFGLSAGIIALLALMAHMAIPTASEQKAAGQTESSEAPKGQARGAGETPEPSTYEGPWIATRHFFMPPEPPPPVEQFSRTVNLQNPAGILGCSNNPKCREKLRQFFGLDEDVPTECILAIVPDPYHTRLALLTDHSIEAILKAAAAAHWDLASLWLPWNDTVDPDERDPASRAQARHLIAAQELQPGALVFRRSAQDANWGIGGLVVWVVGETPIAGVNPVQFQIARAYMKTLSDSDGDTVRIDGPTFSGSFDSLAFLVRQDRKKKLAKKYRIRSGTAQSEVDAREFKRRAEVDDFHSATANLEDQEGRFQDLLNELRIQPNQAAVLAEDESTFGAAVVRRDPNSRSDIFRFRFPRDIAHLRDTYRQVQQGAKPENAPVSGLEFSLKDPSVGEDSVRTYSQMQTPLSQNGVINEIARAMRRFDIRIVRVTATNVLDAMFVASALRRQCPDTRLVIQSADLLYVQAEQTQPLNGTLFLTSYPLFAESRVSEHEKDMTVFPDTLSEGIFNATALLLDRSKDGAADSHPPDWLLTLDRQGFLPVRVWDATAPKSWHEAVLAKNTMLAPPRMWTFLSGAFAVFSLALGIWIIRLRRKPDWPVDARFEASESGDSWRGLYILLFLLILSGIQIVILIARPPFDQPVQLTLALSGIVLPAATTLLYRPGKSHPLAATLAVAAVLAGVGVWSFCCRGFGSQSQWFSFRSAELRWGSSPLWPMVAAAAALLLWCFVQVTRLYLTSRWQPDAMTAGVGVLTGRLEKAYQEFNESARSALGLPETPQRIGFGVALAALAALCYLFRVDRQLGSIDGTPYDVLCIALQILVLTLLLLTCWQIRVFWKSLHCFTTNLGLLPLASAFIPVSCGGSNRPIWVRRSSLKSLENYTHSVLVLHDMALESEQLANQRLSQHWVNVWYGLYRDRIARLMSTDSSRSRQRLCEERRSLWRLSRRISCIIWRRMLMPAWRSQPLFGRMTGEAARKPGDQTSTEQGTPAQLSSASAERGSVTDLAERFVALHYTPFLLHGVRQIQNLLLFPSIGFVLLMLAMTSYNFQAPHWIGTVLLLLFAVITAILATCMVQIERDPILSRIAGTKPGELSATFYLRLIRYGALPVLGLLAAQFPAISNFLFSWMQPALEALK